MRGLGEPQAKVEITAPAVVQIVLEVECAGFQPLALLGCLGARRAERRFVRGEVQGGNSVT